MKKKLAVVFSLVLIIALTFCSCAELDGILDVLDSYEYYETVQNDTVQTNEYKAYTSRDEVAYYIYTHGELPPNFITKAEAQSLGWDGGSLEPYAPGKCIGGDRFGNYEELLPDGEYTECDINTLGKSSRGAERLVFSEDGVIYYTNDHYESFSEIKFEE